MAGTPAPVGRNGPINPFWNAIFQNMRRQQQASAATIAGRSQGVITDRWGNAVEVYGTNLLATVTIGAGWTGGAPVAGVTVTTGFGASPPTAGRAKQANLATGTITVTAGSTAATLNSTTGGTFTNGQLIGAAVVSDPSSGTPTSAILPGTTFTISGTAVTLSQNAAESGTALYCAACNFTLYA